MGLKSKNIEIFKQKEKFEIESFEPELSDNSGDSAKRLFSGFATFLTKSGRRIKKYITIKVSQVSEIHPGKYRMSSSNSDKMFFTPVH